MLFYAEEEFLTEVEFLLLPILDRHSMRPHEMGRLQEMGKVQEMGRGGGGIGSLAKSPCLKSKLSVRQIYEHLSRPELSGVTPVPAHLSEYKNSGIGC